LFFVHAVRTADLMAGFCFSRAAYATVQRPFSFL
jgi:hypothetical protein